jgi:hypothetical protein
MEIILDHEVLVVILVVKKKSRFWKIRASKHLFFNELAYWIFEAVNVWGFWGPAEKNRGDEKIQCCSINIYSWNDVETIWISLNDWPHRTSNT